MSTHISDSSGRHFRRLGRRRGLTLVETLVVLAVVLLLSTIVLPSLRESREVARRSRCAQNLQHIGLGLYTYSHTYGILPPSVTVDATGKPLHSWRTLILPFLGYEDVYRSIDLARPWDDPVNATARESRPACFACPSAGLYWDATTYHAVAGPDACFPPGRSRRLDEITDGFSKTLMVIEAGEVDAVPWLAPRDTDGGVLANFMEKADLPHNGGVHGVFVDGSVRALHKVKMGISPRIFFRALTTVAGGEELSSDSYWGLVRAVPSGASYRPP